MTGFEGGTLGPSTAAQEKDSPIRAGGAVSKHTPGPWIVSGTDTKQIYSQQSGKCVATLPWQNQSGEANARLIAAAPELLAALWRSNQMLIALRDGDIPLSGMDESIVDDNWATIAKAEGKEKQG